MMRVYSELTEKDRVTSAKITESEIEIKTGIRLTEIIRKLIAYGKLRRIESSDLLFVTMTM